jgi:diadenosine tetraphosphatase ApaH/serine/threonine PP2A family protein phosphatase
MQPHWWSTSEKKARWRWLRGLPLRRSEGRFLFVHGSPRDPVREYVLSTDGILNPEKLRSVLEAHDGVGVAGHTHQPGVHDDDLRFHAPDGSEECSFEFEPGKRYFVNVGSTGQPRDGDPRACYAVLEDERVTWYRIEYDFRGTQEKILRTGVLSEILARRLAVGK